ncbi:hypothetical protein NQ318_017618 [Aromia moschata]|uniref:Uncharacterized protein n=1 Tax=Aromia moschata TaxID=1265417 RepID=A0AAV8Z2G8_9CUCU|nr:hypothetical protein NQ318_017618 [Aromia moschata]
MSEQEVHTSVAQRIIIRFLAKEGVKSNFGGSLGMILYHKPRYLIRPKDFDVARKQWQIRVTVVDLERVSMKSIYTPLPTSWKLIDA